MQLTTLISTTFPHCLVTATILQDCSLMLLGGGALCRGPLASEFLNILLGMSVFRHVLIAWLPLPSNAIGGGCIFGTLVQQTSLGHLSWAEQAVSMTLFLRKDPFIHMWPLTLDCIALHVIVLVQTANLKVDYTFSYEYSHKVYKKTNKCSVSLCGLPSPDGLGYTWSNHSVFFQCDCVHLTTLSR